MHTSNPLCCLILSLLLLVGVAACDAGLAPPEDVPQGVVEVVITYANPAETWPTPDALFGLRFVAMPFIPRDTADFLQLNLLAISDALPTQPPRSRDTVRLGSAQGVRPGTYVYSGVAENFRPDDLFAWRPIGLYTADQGIFTVRSAETTRVAVTADFANRPTFPPK